MIDLRLGDCLEVMKSIPTGSVDAVMLRRIVKRIIPEATAAAPKRPVQTPQREWLRGTLRNWTNDHIENALRLHPEWFNADRVRGAWNVFLNGESDNANYIWQWVSISLMGV